MDDPAPSVAETIPPLMSPTASTATTIPIADDFDSSPSAATNPATNTNSNAGGHRRPYTNTVTSSAPSSNFTKQLPPYLRRLASVSTSLSAPPVDAPLSTARRLDALLRGLSKPSVGPAAGATDDVVARYIAQRGEAVARRWMGASERRLYDAWRKGDFIPPVVDDWSFSTAHSDDDEEDGYAGVMDADPVDLKDLYKLDLEVDVNMHSLKAWAADDTMASDDARTVLSAVAHVRKARARVAARRQNAISTAAAAAAAASDELAVDVDVADGGDDDHDASAAVPAAVDVDVDVDVAPAGAPQGVEGEDDGEKLQQPQGEDEGKKNASGGGVCSIVGGGPSTVAGKKEVRVLHTIVKQVRTVRYDARSRADNLVAAMESVEARAVARLQALGVAAETEMTVSGGGSTAAAGGRRVGGTGKARGPGGRRGRRTQGGGRGRGGRGPRGPVGGRPSGGGGEREDGDAVMEDAASGAPADGAVGDA